MTIIPAIVLLATLLLLSPSYCFVPGKKSFTMRVQQKVKIRMQAMTRGGGGNRCQSNKDDRFRVIFTALQQYKAEYGDMYVPSNFIVPDKDPKFSAECWGLPLGTRVQAIRSGSVYQKHRPALNGIGFPWKAEHTRKKEAFERFILALGVYSDCKLGSVNDIPYSFRVPALPPWPPNMHGYWLGRKVTEVRRGVIFTNPRYQQVLSVVGLEVPNTIIATTAEKNIKDNSRGGGDRDAQVPSELTFAYIGEVGGSGEFGEASYEAPRRRDRRRFDLIYRALVRYKELFGHLDVPAKYSVPSSDEEAWPQVTFGDLHGLRLGQAVSNIRQGNSYSDLFYAAQLDRLGFVWSAREFRLAQVRARDASDDP